MRPVSAPGVPTAVVDALAAYRLTRLLTRDSLPPLPAVRDHVQQRWGDHPAATLATCPWCVGFWITAGVGIARRWVPRWWGPLALTLAGSAAVGLLATWDDERNT